MSWYGSHTFLNEYIQNHRCRRIMEIGVLNGDNARTMVEAALTNVPPEEVEYYGFDFFRGYSSQEVERKLRETGCTFTLFKGDTMNTLPQAVKTLPHMDVIFIDGGKSYREATSDWDNAKTLMHEGTAVFVHNYDFPGVRRMVDTISRDVYQVKIIRARFDSDTALITKRL